MTEISSAIDKRPAPQWDLAEARRIVLKALAPWPVGVYLFGSRANGKAGRFSDIDIAVLPETPLPDDVLPALREQLEDSDILYRVDLVDLSQAPADFRQKVLREGIPWSG